MPLSNEQAIIFETKLMKVYDFIEKNNKKHIQRMDIVKETGLNLEAVKHTLVQLIERGAIKRISSSSNKGTVYAAIDRAKTISAEAGVSKEFDKTLKTSNKYLITSAQNGTPIHAKFWKTLQVAAKDMGAELIVIPIRYKNPTSRWSKSQRNAEEWASEVEPYLYNQRKKLNQNLVLLADVKTQPTATSPLTGFEGFTSGESSIIGHTKLQFKSVSVPAGKMPKIMVTTGACTQPNYTDSKQGKLGNFHHALAACMVEIKGKTFHIRQINALNDGSFIDKDRSYSVDGVKAAPRALALSMGDLHESVVDPKVVKATFGQGGIVETFKPLNIVCHDVLDGGPINPHENGNIFISMAKRSANKHKVRQEVQGVCDFIDKYIPLDTTPVIVGSNHDNFLSRWVVNTDWRNDADMENAEFYLTTALAMLKGTKMNKNGASYPSPFVYWAKKLTKHPKLRCLRGDESFALAGVEFGLHGDKGPNGSRGSAKNLARIGVKTVIGHSHSPCIENGCYQSGTSSYLRLGYNSGPSSWLQAHTVQYANGKRTLVIIVDGEWTI